MLFLLAFIACYYCDTFDIRFMTTKDFLRAADELGLELGRRLKEKELPGTSVWELLPRVVEVAAAVLSGKKSGPPGPDLARAKLLARGVLARRRLEEAEGGAISTEEVGENLGVNPASGRPQAPEGAAGGLAYIREAMAISCLAVWF